MIIDTTSSVIAKTTKQTFVLLVLCFFAGTLSCSLSAVNWRAQARALWSKVSQYPQQAFNALKTVELRAQSRAAWQTMTEQNIMHMTKKTLAYGSLLGTAYLICRAVGNHRTSRIATNTYTVDPTGNPYTLKVDTDARVIIRGHHKNTIVVEHHYGTSWLNDLPCITYGDTCDANTRQVTVSGFINPCTSSLWQRILSKIFYLQPKRKLTHVIYVPYATNTNVVTTNSEDYTHKRDTAILIEKVVGKTEASADYGNVIYRRERQRLPGENKPIKGPKTNKRDLLNLHSDIKITVPSAFITPSGSSTLIEGFTKNLRYNGPESALRYKRHFSNNGYVVTSPPNKGPIKAYDWKFDSVHDATPYLKLLEELKKIIPHDDTSKIDSKTLDRGVFVNRDDTYTAIYETTLQPEDFETINGRRQLKATFARKPEAFHMSYP